MRLLGVKNMAKMHTKRKGKSCSKKPLRIKIQEWCVKTEDEVIQLILDFWKQGISTSEIAHRITAIYK